MRQAVGLAPLDQQTHASHLFDTPLAATSKQPSSSSISSRIRQLPPPKWPQQDDRIRQAILNGYRIDHDQTAEHGYDEASDTIYYTHNDTFYEGPPPGLATLVTTYYYMPSKHSWFQYQEWFKYLLACTDPMVVFIQPDWAPFVIQHRQHAPTIIVDSLPFDNLTMPSRFAEAFWWDEVRPRHATLERPFAVPNVYKIWNEKMVRSFIHLWRRVVHRHSDGVCV